MYTPFFIRFFLCNLVISFLIIGILLTKKIFKKHISVNCHYYIWFIFLLILLIPFLPIKPFHLGNIYSWIATFIQSDNGTTSLSAVDNDSNNMILNSGWIQDYSVSVNRSTPKLLNSALIAVWLTGLAAMILITIYGNQKIIRIKKTIQKIKDTEIIFLFEQCKKEIGIHKNIRLCCSPFIDTPITFGFFKPFVILPGNNTSGFSLNDIRYIFLHELQHYKHKDILINYAMCIFRILYWFHPLVGYALKEMSIDREIACDISVLKILDEDRYIEYGNTIINFADKILHSTSITSVADMGGSKKQIQKRILKIASFHIESTWMKIKSAIIFTTIGVIVLVSIPSLSVIAAENYEYTFANNRTEYEDLSPYFEGYEGSFVLYDALADQYQIYNEDKSNERTSPDSTYKIYSALFALETGNITKDDSSFNWDGTYYAFDSWNKNQDLYSAMKNSVTWYFQALDKKTGLINLKTYLEQINYGNSDLSGGLSEYWLESSLKISPIEQVELLKAFYTNQFEFEENNIQTVQDSLLLSESNGAILSGKTGTGVINGKNTNGWFIGYVERNGNTYFFATNIQNDDYSNGSTAAKITLSILDDKNIYKAK